MQLFFDKLPWFWSAWNCCVPKEIQVEFQHITSELDQLLREAHKLRESIEQLPGDDRDTEVQGKLTRLYSKLNEYIKEARTRETLSSALLSEEEKLRTKLEAMEAEQVCGSFFLVWSVSQSVNLPIREASADGDACLNHKLGIGA